MIVKMSVMGILVMGNVPFRFGSHLNLEDIPSFRQPFFDFTSHVTWIIHNIQIIGEAASNLSEDYCREHSEIPWAQIVAMRNILVHEYFGVDLDEIWRTVEQNLPVFKRQIQSLLDQPGNK